MREGSVNVFAAGGGYIWCWVLKESRMSMAHQIGQASKSPSFVVFAAVHTLMFLACFNLCLGFSQGSPMIRTCKSRKPFPPQVDFDHDCYYNNGNINEIPKHGPYICLVDLHLLFPALFHFQEFPCHFTLLLIVLMSNL